MSKFLDMMIAAFDSVIGSLSLSDARIPQFDQSEIKKLCLFSLDLFNSQGTVLRIDDPVVIVGDLHGSLDDLARLIRHFGKPPETKYLFLGDYVDRGDFSVPVLTYLLAVACRFPESVFLIRGNHEFSHINRVYGFYEEILATGESELTWEFFQEVFYYMPLAAVVHGSIFCVHGGLSPSLNSIRRLENIERPVPNYFGDQVVADIVWSDPSDEIEEYGINQRGSGVLFGTEATRAFLEDNRFQLLVRAHQCTKNGVELFANNMGLTVFSCSDYTGDEKNKCGACYARALDDIEIFSFTRLGTVFQKESVKMKLTEGQIGLQSVGGNNVNENKAISKPPLRRRILSSEHNEAVVPSLSGSNLAAKALSATTSLSHVPSIVKTKRTLMQYEPHGSFATAHPVQPHECLKNTLSDKEEKDKRLPLYNDYSQPVFREIEQQNPKPVAAPIPMRVSKRTNSLENSTFKSLINPSLFQPMPITQ